MQILKANPPGLVQDCPGFWIHQLKSTTTELDEDISYDDSQEDEPDEQAIIATPAETNSVWNSFQMPVIKPYLRP